VSSLTQKAAAQLTNGAAVSNPKYCSRRPEIARTTGMADEATFVFANRTAVYWAEPTSERPSDAAGE
jgi:hypothetical protein